jgi:hypothetical protein
LGSGHHIPDHFARDRAGPGLLRDGGCELAFRLSYRTPRYKAESVCRRLQLLSAGAYSLGHGTNDAQKTLGVIIALLLAAWKKGWTSGASTFLGMKQEIAWWIILSCHAAVALGHYGGRLAHRQDHGFPEYSTPSANWWFFSGGGHSHYDRLGHAGKSSYFNDACYRGRRLRRRRDARMALCPLDLGQAHYLGLDTHVSRSWPDPGRQIYALNAAKQVPAISGFCSATACVIGSIY